MPDSAAMQAAHARAIRAAGEPVTFARVPAGATAPTATADVIAVVRGARPNGLAGATEGYPAPRPGAPGMVDREVLVMKADLAAKGFPLPVRKGDRVRVAETGEWLQIDTVDNGRRFAAGCVEATAKGLG